MLGNKVLGGRAGRNRAIDLAKGIGILCIIAGHTPVLHLTRVFLYAFHVPLFFVIAGYLFPERVDTISTPSFICKKIKALLKPYLVLAIGILLFDILLKGNRGNLVDFWAYAKLLVFQKRQTTLWFLAALFFANLIFFFVCKICRKKWRVLLVSIALSTGFILYDILVHKPLFWNIDTAFVAQIFMAVGYCCKKDIDSCSQSKIGALSVGGSAVLLCFALTYVNYKCGAKYFGLYEMQFGITPLTVLAAILGSVGIILLCSLCRVSAVEYIGENSLVYFGWHQAIALPLAWDIFRGTLYAPWNWVKLVTLILVTVFICFGLDKLLEATKIKAFMYSKKR